MSFYEHKESVGCAPLECVVSEGEILFVPVRVSGLWVRQVMRHEHAPRHQRLPCSAHILLPAPASAVPPAQRNWWHCVLNLDECVAVTQNFVSEVTLPHVLAHLRSRSPALVSGCAKESRAGLYDRFVQVRRRPSVWGCVAPGVAGGEMPAACLPHPMQALQQHRPELLARVEEQAAAARRRTEEQHKLAGLFKEAPAAAATQQANGGCEATNGGGFSFAFQV